MEPFAKFCDAKLEDADAEVRKKSVKEPSLIQTLPVITAAAAAAVRPPARRRPPPAAADGSE
jgi:hypothetical protein